MKSRWSILTPLVIGAFAVMFFILLYNLSGNLNTLLDITRINQNDSQSTGKETEGKNGTVSVKEIGGPLFRGKITAMGGFEKTQNQIDQSETDLLTYLVPLEKIATDEEPISSDRNSERNSEKASPQVNSGSIHFDFCVHYASYKDLTDAKTEVARLSGKGRMVQGVYRQGKDSAGSDEPWCETEGGRDD
jgi:hypothetical protein